MTPAQAAALERPCYLALEVLHPALGYRRAGYTLRLCIAAGYE